MHKPKLLLSLLLMACVLGAAVPTLAHSGHEHSEDNRQAAEEAKLRGRGQELLTQLKKERQTHTQAERNRNCQSHKQGLQQKLSSLTENAQKHKARIDNIFAKTLAYKQDHNLTVENFETLNAAALSAQANAQSSTEALTSLKPTLDCNNESVAADVAAFKVALAQARSDLSEYRQAVKSLLRAVQAAVQGGQQ